MYTKIQRWLIVKSEKILFIKASHNILPKAINLKVEQPQEMLLSAYKRVDFSYGHLYVATSRAMHPTHLNYYVFNYVLQTQM